MQLGDAGAESPTPALAAIGGVLLAPLLFTCAIWIYQKRPTEASVVIGYLVVNCGLSLLNRWGLGMRGFRFPLSMTALHMAFGSVALTPFMALHSRYRAGHARALRSRWRGIVTIGLLNCLQIGANNSALVLIELSLNQVLRAFSPVAVAALAVCIERRPTTRSELATLVMIGTGVALAAGKAVRVHSTVLLCHAWARAAGSGGARTTTDLAHHKNPEPTRRTPGECGRRRGDWCRPDSRECGDACIDTLHLRPPPRRPRAEARLVPGHHMLIT